MDQYLFETARSDCDTLEKQSGRLTLLAVLSICCGLAGVLAQLYEK